MSKHGPRLGETHALLLEPRQLQAGRGSPARGSGARPGRRAAGGEASRERRRCGVTSVVSTFLLPPTSHETQEARWTVARTRAARPPAASRWARSRRRPESRPGTRCPCESTHRHALDALAERRRRHGRERLRVGCDRAGGPGEPDGEQAAPTDQRARSRQRNRGGLAATSCGGAAAPGSANRYDTASSVPAHVRSHVGEESPPMSSHLHCVASEGRATPRPIPWSCRSAASAGSAPGRAARPAAATRDRRGVGPLRPVPHPAGEHPAGEPRPAARRLRLGAPLQLPPGSRVEGRGQDRRASRSRRSTCATARRSSATGPTSCR